jgi:hypothetical protein
MIEQPKNKDRTNRLPRHCCSRRLTGSAKGWALVLALAVTGTASISAARADEAQAKSLFKAMSDYLAAQKAISLDYDTNLEIVSTQQQKVGLASSGTVTLTRPDKLHVTRAGGFANVEMVFDGKTLTLLGKNANLYAQVEAPGTIDQLVDVLRDKYQRPVPGADLLTSDPDKELITSKQITGWPQYMLDITAWKTGTEVAPDSFKLEIPSGAKKLMPDEIPDLNEIPGIFTIKGAK